MRARCRSVTHGIFVAGIVAVSAVPAVAQQSIRMATSWGGGPHLDVMAKGFAKNVELLTDGKLKFEVFPAGTIGSPLKVTETVQRKVAQAGHHWSGYDYGIDKTAVLFGGYAGSMPAEHYLHWLYEGGGAEIWRQWRLEKYGLIAMPCGSHADEIHMVSHRPIRRIEDLKGLKLRTSGAWAEIAGSLGASTVVLSGPDTFPALEKKVVDAIEWANPSINYALGFHKVAKYHMLPGVHQASSAQECLFDKAVWDALAPRNQQLIETAAKMAVVKAWMQFNNDDTIALGKLKAEGAEFVVLEPSYIEAVKSATRDWEDKTAEAEGVWFKKVLHHQRAFAKQWEVASQYRSELK
jgi:TRAP-type mannitol/chloroaromatic compound transport system substrate-binding protein